MKEKIKWLESYCDSIEKCYDRLGYFCIRDKRKIYISDYLLSGEYYRDDNGEEKYSKPPTLKTFKEMIKCGFSEML